MNNNSTSAGIVCLAFLLTAQLCAGDDPANSFSHRDSRKPVSQSFSAQSASSPVAAEPLLLGTRNSEGSFPLNSPSTLPDEGTPTAAADADPLTVDPSAAIEWPEVIEFSHSVPPEYSEYRNSIISTGSAPFGCRWSQFDSAGQLGICPHHPTGIGCSPLCPSYPICNEHGGAVKSLPGKRTFLNTLTGSTHRQRREATRSAAISRMSPLGATQSAWMGVLVSSANSAQLMLYDYDFVTNRPELTVRGTRELRSIAVAIQRSRSVVRIEATPYAPELATMRRATVVEQLSDLLPEVVTDERVLISEPLSRGFGGEEALGVDSQLLELQGFGSSGQGVRASRR